MRLSNTCGFGLMVVLALVGCAHQGQPDKSPGIGGAIASQTKATPVLAPDLSSNPPPRVATLNSNLPTIFIAGDSTAARGSGEDQHGWAVPFPEYFDLKKVDVFHRN